MKVGYIILAHQDPEHVARLAALLVEDGGLVAIHFDLNAGAEAFARLQEALGPACPRVCWPQRVRVGWGEWSIVAATLNALDAIAASGEAVDHVHLMSGTDYPIRPLSEFRSYLSQTGGDFIECHDMHKERWVKDGLTHERYRYRHPLSWRRRPKVFDMCWQLQRMLGLGRAFPKGLMPHLGSQWWTLSWATCRLVLDAGRDPAFRRFFRTVWIPDEMFIQSVVGSRVAAESRHRHGLTLFQFTDRGLPVVFANDHLDHLTRQPFFFARKLSRHAGRLRDALDEVARGARPVPPIEFGSVGCRSTKYDETRLAQGKPRPGRRVMGRDADPWRGDLVWNDRPFIAVLGASSDELRLVQHVLTATGALECHGALFDPKRIDFAAQRRRFAGYERSDVKLRDSRRTTFLSDVIEATAPATCAFLMPWKRDEGMRDVVLWSRQACALMIRGNAFRSYLEHATQSKACEPSSGERPADRWVSPMAFDAFYRTYEEYYDKVADAARKSGSLFVEVSLLQAGWLQRLRHFVECAVPPVRLAAAAPTLPPSSELVARLAARLADPAASIDNIRGLTELRLNAEHRAAHRELLQQSQQLAMPDWDGIVAVSREHAG